MQLGPNRKTISTMTVTCDLASYRQFSSSTPSTLSPPISFQLNQFKLPPFKMNFVFSYEKYFLITSIWSSDIPFILVYTQSHLWPHVFADVVLSDFSIYNCV